jgi:hypothetical protein
MPVTLTVLPWPLMSHDVAGWIGGQPSPDADGARD